MKYLFIAVLLTGCVKGQQADFYECPPNNTLKVCTPGTVPDNCESVGSGTTTATIENC